MLEQESIYDPSPIIEPTVKVNFDKFYNASIKKAEEQQAKDVPVSIDITSIDSLLLMDLEQTPEEQIYGILISGYQHILHSLMNLGEVKYVQLFTSNKFLMVLNNVLNHVPTIDVSTICHINKLIYDYSVLQDRNEYTLGLFMTLARTVNRSIISKLRGLGLSEQTATDIAICRYSSPDEIICTKRLTNCIIQQSHTVMTEQMLVDIYQLLYSSMTSLFIGVMYDILSPQDLAFSPDADVINSTINLAVLDLLENMTTVDIRKVLIAYASTFGLNSNFSRVRFDICACPDYPRILEVANLIQTTEQIQLP